MCIRDRHQENAEFFSKIANDPNLTMEERKAAIKAHREQQKAENHSQHETQKSERKDLLEKIKSE